MVGGDDQARIQVEAMGIGPVDSDAGVEVNLVAAEPSGLRDKPVEQLAPVSASPQARLWPVRKPATAQALASPSSNAPTSR